MLPADILSLIKTPKIEDNAICGDLKIKFLSPVEQIHTITSSLAQTLTIPFSAFDSSSNPKVGIIKYVYMNNYNLSIEKEFKVHLVDCLAESITPQTKQPVLVYRD